MSETDSKTHPSTSFDSIHAASHRFPASTELAIVGRVPTAWLLEHMHSFSRQEFYDQALSEDDLKAILAKRMS